MRTGLETFLGLSISPKAPKPSAATVLRRPLRPPVIRGIAPSSITPVAPVARIALESAVVLGIFAAFSAFVARAVYKRTAHKKPRCIHNIAVMDNYDDALIAFQNFQLSS